MGMSRFVCGTINFFVANGCIIHQGLGVQLQAMRCVHMNYMFGGIEVTRAFVALLVFHQILSVWC